MLHEIMPFVIKHWPLVGAFIAVCILLFIEETRAQGGRGGQLTPARVTHLINREDAVVVDVRDANAYRDGHIVNAKNIPLADFDRQLEKLNAFRDRPIILVDAMGAKTASLAIRLRKDGFAKAATLKGGMESWKTAGMPVVGK